MNDDFWMAAAVRLAQMGLGYTTPNPPVGAVVVQNGRCVGRGFHARAGTPHAEIWALRQARHQTTGATLYVTLEPCCHHGRTPPCTEAIAQAGIRRVVVGALDPNPAVHGRGVETLQRLGIQVDIGVLPSTTELLVRGFVSRWQRRRPWVILKMAVTADGRIARVGSRRLPITPARTRAWVHHLRATCDAIMVGYYTAILDIPDLTPRMARWVVADKPYWRVILDTNLRIPPDHPVLHGSFPTVVFHDIRLSPPPPQEGLEYEGVPTTAPGMLDLQAVCERLADRGVHRLLVEGGGRVASSLLAMGLVDECWLLGAPAVFGDRYSVGMASHLDTRVTGPVEWRPQALIPLGEAWLCIFRSQTARP